MPSDYLILGSGLAGLSAGALLARRGASVRVLEAHYHPGGYGHTFVEGPYRFNAQLHYVWNCGEGRTVNNFLRKLGLDEEVTFEEYDRQGFDRMRMPGYALDIPGDLGLLGDRLSGLLPADAPAIRGFLAEVCRAWESSADPAREKDVRVVHPRIGLVLSSEGGALAKMLPAFRMGLGGRLGSGRLWMSWIGLDDLLGLLHQMRFDFFQHAFGAYVSRIEHQKAFGNFNRLIGIPRLQGFVCRLYLLSPAKQAATR